MKKIRLLFIIFFICCILTKCQNEENSQISKNISFIGKIIDKQTTKPIDSVKIILGENMGSFMYGDIAYYLSDSIGNYNLHFNPVASKSYSLEFYKKGYKSDIININLYESSQFYSPKLEKVIIEQ